MVHTVSVCAETILILLILDPVPFALLHCPVWKPVAPHGYLNLDSELKIHFLNSTTHTSSTQQPHQLAAIT